MSNTDSQNNSQANQQSGQTEQTEAWSQTEECASQESSGVEKEKQYKTEVGRQKSKTILQYPFVFVSPPRTWNRMDLWSKRIFLFNPSLNHKFYLFVCVFVSSAMTQNCKGWRLLVEDCIAKIT